MQVTVSGKAELGPVAEWEEASPALSLSPTSAGALPSSQALPAPKWHFCPLVAKTGAAPKLVPQVPPAPWVGLCSLCPGGLDAQRGLALLWACTCSLGWMGPVTSLSCQGNS